MLEELETGLDYRFRDLSLLQHALTHSSYANENRNGAGSNERLEFLGDSILGFLTAERLFQEVPEKPEGELTRQRAALVCEGSLARAAKRLGLGKVLRLGKGEEHSGGRENDSMLADAVESVIAAVYLDGGMESARAVVEHIIFQPEEAAAVDNRDYKTLLQERIQRNHAVSLTYQLTDTSGPDHARIFTITAYLDGIPVGTGNGRSKKAAEQAAAHAALDMLTFE